jgi:hypothetical protein
MAMAHANGSGNGRDEEARLSATDRLLARKLDRWAARSPPSANAVAVVITALLMLWLLAGSRELPDRASVLSTIGTFMGSCHLAAHLFIVTGLKKLHARGIAAADRARQAYLARVTQRDVAIAWGLFTLIVWL